MDVVKDPKKNISKKQPAKKSLTSASGGPHLVSASKIAASVPAVSAAKKATPTAPVVDYFDFPEAIEAPELWPHVK